MAVSKPQGPAEGEPRKDTRGRCRMKCCGPCIDPGAAQAAERLRGAVEVQLPLVAAVLEVPEALWGELREGLFVMRLSLGLLQQDSAGIAKPGSPGSSGSGSCGPAVGTGGGGSGVRGHRDAGWGWTAACSGWEPGSCIKTAAKAIGGGGGAAERSQLRAVCRSSGVVGCVSTE